MDISIVIPVCFEPPSLVRNCIQHIHQTPDSTSFEIWVVNNNSPHDYRSELNDLSYRQIDVPYNSGYAEACNRGAANARGTFLLLLNPDTEIDPDLLPFLCRHLREHPDTGILGPEVRYPNGGRTLTVLPDPSPWTFFCQMNYLAALFPQSKLFAGYRHAYPWEETEEPLEVDWVGGMAMCMRRKDYETINGMENNFRLYLEDTDLCLRVRRQLDKKILFHPEGSLVHVGGGGSQELGLFPSFNALRSHLLFSARYFSFFGRLFALLGLLPRLLATAVLSLFSSPVDTRDHPFPGRFSDFCLLLFVTSPLSLLGIESGDRVPANTTEKDPPEDP